MPERELKFIQIATSESASMDGPNSENLYGLTKEGDVYYHTQKEIPGETLRIYGWKKLTMLNLDF